MFDTSIPCPNPQNSLDILYYFFTGKHLEPGASIGGVFFFIQELELIGLLFSIVFLIVFIYMRLKHERLIHAAGERRREEEEAVAGMMKSTAAANPRSARWARIMDLMGSNNPNDWRLAILDADVMLDDLLNERGFVGRDMGEKLQSGARGQFVSIDSAREAHGTRNRIAHGGVDYALTDREARLAIDGYRRVFEEFSYI